jgi:hypothetical protein
MPGSWITQASSSSSIGSSSNALKNSGAVIPILQDLMKGQGWHDQRSEVLARDQEEALITSHSKQAAASYIGASTAANRAKLIAALSDELADLEKQRDYAQTQQHQYEVQAKKEAKEQANRPQGWREWFKSWLVATPEQQAKEQTQKYIEVAAARQARINQLQPILLQLKTESAETLLELTVAFQEAEQIESEEEVTEALTNLSKKNRSVNRQQAADHIATQLEADAAPLFPGRRLLQSNLTDSVEFRVNTYTVSEQRFPAVAGLSNGDFVIAWSSLGQDGSGYGVYAQHYAANGTAMGAEFQANTYTFSQQDSPSIAGLSNGDFVIAWEGYGQEFDVYAQRYAVDGTALGAEFQVNTYTLSNQHSPSIAGLSNGDFVIAWASDGQDGSSWGVYAQRYAANGTPLGLEFRVNTYTASLQEAPSVTGLSNGDFVIAWESYGQELGSDVYAQRYAANGTPLGLEFRVNTYTADLQNAPSIVGLSSGDFVIAWASYEQDGDYFGVFAQRYATNGTAMGAEFQVNTYTRSNQDSPSIAGLSNGDFVIAWESLGQYSGASFYTQRYTANGTAVGAEFRVNTHSLSISGHPSIAGLSNGDFVVTWASDGQDGDSYGVYARLCDDSCQAPELTPSSSLDAVLIAGAAGGGMVALCLFYFLYRYGKQYHYSRVAPQRRSQRQHFSPEVELEGEPDAELLPSTFTAPFQNPQPDTILPDNMSANVSLSLTESKHEASLQVQVANLLEEEPGRGIELEQEPGLATALPLNQLPGASRFGMAASLSGNANSLTLAESKHEIAREEVEPHEHAVNPNPEGWTPNSPKHPSAEVVAKSLGQLFATVVPNGTISQSAASNDVSEMVEPGAQGEVLSENQRHLQSFSS